MNAGATSERVYDALKARLLDAEFHPGERLDPALLSESLGSSVTPVRDALNQLTGERLVETRTGEGFYRPHLTAPDLQDLYHWAAQVTALAIRSGGPAPLPVRPAVAPDIDIAARTAALFQAIAQGSANLEHRRAIAAINDRLHAVRRVEGLALGDLVPEMDAIAASAETGRRALLHDVSGYFRRRARMAHEIVRAAYRDS